MKPDPLAVRYRIKSIRGKLGLNQKDFAKLIDATVPAVSNWENGRSLPNNERLKRIAAVGNTTVDDLIKGNSKKTVEETVDEIKDNFNSNEIKQIIRQLI